MAVSERRQREREARRQAILTAAERIISERGLWATTMEDVAAEAELSKGTLYLYFDNRDALCAALAVRNVGSLLPDLERIMSHAGTGLGRLKALLDFFHVFFSTHPHVIRMAVSWMIAGIQCAPDDPDFVEYRKRLARVTALAVNAIQLGQQDGSIRPGIDPHLLGVQVWAGFVGTLLFQVNQEDMLRRIPVKVDADALAPMYVEHMIRAIQREPAP